MNDGFLNALVYRNFSTLTYLRHAISISQGRRTLEPRISRRKIRTMHVAAEYPVAIHADGEPKGETPAYIEIKPAVLRVRVPEKVAAGPRMTKQSHHRKRIDRDQNAKDIMLIN
jgi:diacylglycerol kinase family enzyme